MAKRTLMPGKIYVEDAASGPILIEKYPRFTEAFPHQWTAEGKDLRAYAVQRFFNSGRVRMTKACYRKVGEFQGRHHQPSLDRVELLRARGQTSVEAR